MYQIFLTDEFDTWLNSIRDSLTKRRLARRLEKAENGNLGDVKAVGKGVWEMREFFSSGWRMYYVQQGNSIIVMLGSGDKSTQSKDIQNAIKLATNLGLLK